MEYNSILEQVFRTASDLDKKLPMVWVMLKDEAQMRRLIAIVSPSFHPRFFFLQILTICPCLDRSCAASASADGQQSSSLLPQSLSTPKHVTGAPANQ
jgi:hypothetical protein